MSMKTTYIIFCIELRRDNKGEMKKCWEPLALCSYEKVASLHPYSYALDKSICSPSTGETFGERVNRTDVFGSTNNKIA